jgi:hypothetical protein
MSLHTLKKKAVINYGSNRSAKPPGGIWVSQGPFGKNTTLAFVSGPVGFSLQGGRRSSGYIGQSMAMSKNGTPYKGTYAMGNGGKYSTYVIAQPVLNANSAKIEIRGSQYQYIKPSVLSSKGMLEKKYKWIHSGQYPNYWVQPVYPTGSLSQNASQWLYILKKAAQNDVVTDVNNYTKYQNYRVQCNCPSKSFIYRYNTISSRPGYTKFLKNTLMSSERTLKIQRSCALPTGTQKPFPFAVNTGVIHSRISTEPPAIQRIYYTEAPDWYTNTCL